MSCKPEEPPEEHLPRVAYLPETDTLEIINTPKRLDRRIRVTGHRVEPDVSVWWNRSRVVSLLVFNASARLSDLLGREGLSSPAEMGSFFEKHASPFVSPRGVARDFMLGFLNPKPLN